MFSSSGFTVSDIMFKSLIIFFKSTLVLRMRQRSTVILACGYAFPPTPSLDGIVLSLRVLGTRAESQ